MKPTNLQTYKPTNLQTYKPESHFNKLISNEFSIRYKSRLWRKYFMWIQSVGLLLILVFCVQLPANAQSWGSIPHAGTLQLNGIPDSIEVTKSYRSQTEIFYLIPDNTSLLDFNDLDKTFMQPSEKDERIVIGRNSIDSSIYIRQVLDAALQFNAQSAPYSHTVFYNDTAIYYGLEGQPLLTYPISDTSYSGGEGGGGPGIDTSFQFIGNGKLKYSGSNLEITLDTAYHTVFVEEFDSTGLWLTRHFRQFDPTDTMNVTPVFTFVIQRTYLPSDNCVFHVRQVTNSEFFQSDSLDLREYQGNTPQKENFDLSIYPNPSNNRFWVKIPEEVSIDPARDINIRIHSTDGTVIYERQLESTQLFEVNIPNANPGMYIISINDGKHFWIEKIFKN